jgi:DNA polymerase-3 subunit alpha
VGFGAVEPIIAERNKGGDFKSVEDMCRRCDLRGINRRVMESLIKAGVLDRLADVNGDSQPVGNRGTLLNNVDRILSLAQREQRLRETGQSTMFDLWGETAPTPMPDLALAPVEISDKEKYAWEKELMGVCLSEEPFSPVTSKTGAETTFCGQVDAELDGQNIVVAGRVTSVRYLFTRDNRAFASAVLADFSGQVDVMVWSKVYAETRELWQEDSELVVEGRVRLRDDRVQLSCDRVRLYQPEAVQEEEVPAREPAGPLSATGGGAVSAAPAVSQRVIITISQTGDKDRDVDRLHGVVDALKDFPGQDEVGLRVTNGDKIVNLKLSNIRTGYCPGLHERLVELVGEDGLTLEKAESTQ